jgi:hypothetical protein
MMVQQAMTQNKKRKNNDNGSADLARAVEQLCHMQ